MPAILINNSSYKICGNVFYLLSIENFIFLLLLIHHALLPKLNFSHCLHVVSHYTHKKEGEWGMY
jgi:hypothetical protein